MLHYREAGSGPLMLLLHGFPDTGELWRQQFDFLKESFQVVAPDLRGYGLSPRPKKCSHYRIDLLVEDVLGLLAGRPALLVGHDWGGVIAWHIASRRPHLVRKLAVLNCPHPKALVHELCSNPTQLARSWYMLFFQLPWLPEQVMMRNTRRWLAFHPGPEDYLAHLTESLAHPGACTAALNYYRAALRYPGRPAGRVASPTLVLWGSQDRALGLRSALRSAHWLDGPLELQIWPDAGHWVQLDQPERTCRKLLEFFQSTST